MSPAKSRCGSGLLPNIAPIPPDLPNDAINSRSTLPCTSAAIVSSRKSEPGCTCAGSTTPNSGEISPVPRVRDLEPEPESIAVLVEDEGLPNGDT